MEKKVSVIVPVYNMEKYLRPCLDSISEQTLRDIEILCINDGSTDDSPKILEDYAKKDPRVSIINHKHSGVAVARNHGIEAAQGEYLIFMDSDDWYPTTNVLEVLYNCAIEHGARICGGEFSDYNELTGKICCNFPEQYFGYTFEREGMTAYSDYQFDYGYQRFLFKRDFILETGIRFHQLTRFQDPPFMIQAMIMAEDFYAVKKVVYRYRYNHRGNIWNSQKVCDLVRGLVMDLEMAMANGLFRLKDLTFYRLYNEFGLLISDEIAAGNKEILEMVYGFHNELFNSVINRQINELNRIQKELYLLEKTVQELDAELNHLKQSKTFRVGQAIIYIPQKIYWRIKNRKGRKRK